MFISQGLQQGQDFAAWVLVTFLADVCVCTYVGCVLVICVVRAYHMLGNVGGFLKNIFFITMKGEMIYFFIKWKLRDHQRLNNCTIMHRVTYCLIPVAVTLLEYTDTQLVLRELSDTGFSLPG